MNFKTLFRPAMATAMAAILSMTLQSSSPSKTMTQTPDNMTRVEINTTAGPIVIGLYNDTPRHRDNFLKLVDEGFYNGLLFHRVIRDFMVQTGDPESRNAPAGKMLGAGNAGYEIDAEILCPTHINKRGALAAARTGDQVNPERRSSGSQFYIVTGRRFTDAELDRMEHQGAMQQVQDIFNRLATASRDTIMTLRRNRDQAGLQALQERLVNEAKAEAAASPFRYSDAQRAAYREQGGAPHLDGAYTVFGEVIDGLDTVEAIERAATDANDRPVDDVKILSMKRL